MYNINDYVVYKKDVCRVSGIRENYFKNTDYYTLIPVYDGSLKIDVPVNSNLIRKVIEKEEVESIINAIPNIDVIAGDDKLMESEYNNLLHNGDYISLIKIIKTTYLRNDNRIKNKKKISEKDVNYFNLAERYLYGEFAIALGMSYDDTKSYVIDRVRGIDKKCS
ncbi:MAG: CarD family transcriptional regulator [Bacilli bacterium]